MVKDQEYLRSKASYCLDLAKKLGAPNFLAKSKQYDAFDLKYS